MTDLGTIVAETLLGPNSQLVGRDDARQCLSTPVLIVDIDVLERNIFKMAGSARSANVQLRPHAKSHKCIAIANRQLAAGAVGLCCASIGEAEVMGRAGIGNLLITSPLATVEKIHRFCNLARDADEVKVVVDNADNVRALSAAAASANRILNVLVDIDPGMQRTGVSGQSATIELAKMVETSPHLVFCGLQCYAGHIQHLDEREKRREMSLRVLQDVAAIRDVLCAEGLPPAIISGAGTGTYDIDAELQILTELQVGSYIFMDAQYNKVWANEGLHPPFETSLFVQTTVTSANQSGFVTTDAGLKQFSMDGGKPIPAKGAPPGASYFYAGDEHGCLQLPSVHQQLSLGTRIECIVPHCDPTVNLYNFIHCFRGDTLLDIWPIDARGV